MDYTILILTDHSVHTSENSVYALASAFIAHPNISAVDIASRGITDNQIFFNGNPEAVLSVIPAVPKLNYEHALELYKSACTEAELSDYDFVILRLPQPVPEKLFRSLGESIPEDHIINSPRGIMHTGSKEFLLEVADLCPPIRLVKSESALMEFLQLHPLVLKPLYGYGGKGIIKVTGESAEIENGNQISHDDLFLHWKPPYLAMKFLMNVAKGDKRTVVVNGETVGSSLRKPAPGHWMCNVAQGGIAEHAIADADELHIAQRLAKAVGKYDIVMFGFDTLMEDDGRRVLSEVNTMSIGGLKQIRNAEGKPTLIKIVDLFAQHMDRVWHGLTGAPE